MELQVCYANPSSNGPFMVRLEDVERFTTANHELLVFLTGDRESEPSIRFASGKWIWYQCFYPEADDKKPLRRDRHHVDNDEPETGASPAAALRPSPRNRRRPSNLDDLAIPDAADIERARAASVIFAIDHKTIPWSEAHMKAVLEYEKMVEAEYGPDQVMNLPWNKVPRGEDAKRRM